MALLEAVEEDAARLGDILEAEAGPLAGLAAPERARAQRLAAGVLRHRGRAEAVVKPYLRKRPPPPVARILRLAALELAHDGAAAHGVIDGAVDLARRDRRSAAHAGLVNAVLRRAADDAAARWQAAPPQRLPDWLRGRLSAAWGNAAVAAMEAVFAADPPLDLTPADGDAAALAARLSVTGPAAALATGSVRLPAGRQVSALPGFEAGAFWVQDAAAALPARLLAPRHGERILDLCAAPGGKTLQLSAAGARVTALDISDRRLRRLRQNLERCGLAADVVAADALTWQGGEGFDAVLVDAPCSATGTIRRHPDLPLADRRGELPALAVLQAALIDRALALVRPGGRVVFCTCSLLPEEGEAQARAAEARHPDLRRDADAVAALGLPDDLAALWQSPEGLRIRPDHLGELGGIDGFFACAWRRQG